MAKPRKIGFIKIDEPKTSALTVKCQCCGDSEQIADNENAVYYQYCDECEILEYMAECEREQEYFDNVIDW